jgi:hypothetical protein
MYLLQSYLIGRLDRVQTNLTVGCPFQNEGIDYRVCFTLRIEDALMLKRVVGTKFACVPNRINSNETKYSPDILRIVLIDPWLGIEDPFSIGVNEFPNFPQSFLENRWNPAQVVGTYVEEKIPSPGNSLDKH